MSDAEYRNLINHLSVGAGRTSFDLSVLAGREDIPGDVRAAILTAADNLSTMHRAGIGVLCKHVELQAALRNAMAPGDPSR